MRNQSIFAVFGTLMFVACAGDPSANDTQTDQSAASADMPTAEPRENLFANEYAEASVITLEPGQMLPPHSSGARAIYSLSNYTVRLTQGGQPEEQSWTNGQAHFHAAGEHTLENIGTTQAKFLVVARTSQPLAQTAEHEDDEHAASSRPMQPLLNNDDMIIAEYTLAPGAELPRHPGRDRIVYSLTDYTISYALNDAAAEQKSLAAGEAHWHAADEHAITNTGSTEARFVIVQFKR